MHALPADRGNEVVDSVIDGPHSITIAKPRTVSYRQAVMAMTMGDK
jgi:ornithine carbamoyltransferase